MLNPPTLPYCTPHKNHLTFSISENLTLNLKLKKTLYFRKLNILAKIHLIKLTLKDLIKLPNTLSEATLGTLKKLILEKVHFQNYFYKKYFFKITFWKIESSICFNVRFIRRRRKIIQIIMNMPNYFSFNIS